MHILTDSAEDSGPVSLIGKVEVGKEGGVDKALDSMGREPSYGEMLALAHRYFHHSGEPQERRLGDNAPERNAGAAKTAKESTPGSKKKTASSSKADTKENKPKKGSTKAAVKPAEAVVGSVIPKAVVHYQGLEIKSTGQIPRLSQITIVPGTGHKERFDVYYTTCTAAGESLLGGPCIKVRTENPNCLPVFVGAVL